MSDLFFGKSKTIFDILDESEEVEILKEAPEDEGNDDAGSDESTADDSGETTEAEDTGDEENTDDAAEDDMGNDEDFDVDTTISDDDESGDGSGDDADNDMGDDTGGDLDSGDEEVNPKNTDIFSTLSAEEQSIKIAELKRLYSNLYIYVTDMLGKVNDINPDEDNLESIYRVTSGLYELRTNIGHYIRNIFPIKSYIENDIAYNRYLIIIRSMTNVLNAIATEMEEKVQKSNKK